MDIICGRLCFFCRNFSWLMVLITGLIYLTGQLLKIYINIVQWFKICLEITF